MKTGLDRVWKLRSSTIGREIEAIVETLRNHATVAYNASTGAKLWVKLYNGTGNADDTAAALGVSPDGSKLFVTGVSRGLTSVDDYATVAYS